ncbi:hypothetical protein RO3G_10205 [Rhizopus delemar RA 99-880]|uniref:Uncharacterized protein n=1 Tax=Rhizopus delemar (strain RA 99-880 / ATCC MYA-4621 / FGSC 9543 / NRRL 43880) TaxID=246409 RepID=I1CAL5_RHIO9|nr:hypothetical protein RO3G_10205 [Rhizopus delemar RA 99-880]|eukprot:EIE85495.1 hypothetical protein RO3G_10205 [Rhizopus delemar RA 99-880]
MLNVKLFIFALVTFFCLATVSAKTCKCVKGASSITRKVCNELHFKVGTDGAYSAYGTTTCYNMSDSNTKKYFIPKCKDLGGSDWVCY